MNRLAIVFVATLTLAACEKKFERPDTGSLAPGVQEAIAAAEARFDQDHDAADSAQRQAEVWGRLCYIYHAHHLYQAAGDCYQRALSAEGDDSEWHYLLAHVNRARGLLPDAVDGFRRVLELQPNNTAAMYNRGVTLLELGNPESALPLLRKLHAQERNAAVLAAIGRAHLMMRDYNDAVDALERALSLQPQATRLHYPAAMAWRGLGDVDRATSHLRQVGDVEPYFADPLMQELMQLSSSAQRYQERGRAALEAGDVVSAEREFRAAVQVDPDDASSHATLALLLERTGRLDEAIEQLRTATVLNPHDANYHYLLGVMSERLGNEIAAEPAYRKAIELDPQYAEAHLLLGHSEMRRRDYPVALEHYTVAAEQMQQSLLARYHAGLAALAAGDCMIANDFFTQALARQQNYGPVIMAMIRTRSVCPDFVDQRTATLELAQELYAAAPDNDEVRATLAMALAASGDFLRAAEVQPDKPGYRRDLAQYQKKQPAGRAWDEDASVFWPPLLKSLGASAN